MQVPAHSPRRKAKSAVALWLTFAAGIIDIIGYITVYHTFMAHMTGNTVHLGNKLALGDWSESAKAGCTILSFILGSVVGRAVIEAGARAHRRTVASFTLFTEALLVLGFAWLGRSVLHPGQSQGSPLSCVCGLLALLAAAMGLQTATLTRIGPLTVHTTFVTGMLNKFAQAISEWLFWVHDRWREEGSLRSVWHASRQHAALRNANFVFSIWLMYMTGAVAGTWMNSRWSLRAMYIPVAILLLSIVVDQFRPLSVEEEQDQV
ncbi:MAG TPA: YoaK family protein [Terriglobales bacterium]|nr:YoaK family protein [Terriglobales bacterium]